MLVYTHAESFLRARKIKRVVKLQPKEGVSASQTFLGLVIWDILSPGYFQLDYFQSFRMWTRHILWSVTVRFCFNRKRQLQV